MASLERFTGFLGLAAILAVAWLLSHHKRAIKLRILLWGMGLQFVFAWLVLETRAGDVFKAASVGVTNMLAYSRAGSTFVFGICRYDSLLAGAVNGVDWDSSSFPCAFG